MNLTDSEQERKAYIANDIVKADLFDKLMEAEDTSELDGIDSALDSVGLYGYRGVGLEDALISMDTKLTAYKEALSDLWTIPRLPKAVKDALEKLGRLE